MLLTHSITLGADAAVMLNPLKPLLIILTVLPWAWLISSVLDKDAMYFHLPRAMWNGIHMVAGAVAVLSMIFIPVFWIGWPVGIVVLLTPVLVYWKIRNARVPENKRFYLSTESIASKLASRKAAAATRAALLSFVDSTGTARDVPQKDDPLFQTHLLVEDVLGPAVDARASRVEMVPGPSGYVVAQTIDGFRYRRDPMAPDAANFVIDYLKGIAGLDVQNRRRRQVGKMHLNSPAGRKEMVLTTAGSSSGQELRLEFDRSEQLDRPFDSLGLLPQQLESLQPCMERENRHGIILLGTPPGHGLTTLGYSAIGRHDAYTTNIKTLEREVMLRRDGVDHVAFDANNPDIDFATHLQSLLRRDPDVVLVTDLTDKETARVAANHTRDGGPLIYVLQRQPGVREQIVDWVKRVGDIKLAVRPMVAVLNERLVRTLCPNCRQPYQPAAEQLKRLGLPSSVQQLFKAGGKVQVKNRIENCPVCQGTGFFGQIGVFEVMVLDDGSRKLIANNDLQGAYTYCRRNKMVFMQEAALKKVVEGVTSLEEVNRVLGGASRNGQSQTPQPQPVPA